MSAWNFKLITLDLFKFFSYKALAIFDQQPACQLSCLTRAHTLDQEREARPAADALRTNAVALGRDRRVVGVRVVAADNVEPLGARGAIGAHILAWVEVEAIGQRMLVLGLAKPDLGAPIVRCLVNRLDG